MNIDEFVDEVKKLGIDVDNNKLSLLDRYYSLLTEWNEFRRPDFERIKKLMNEPVIFDGRNQYAGMKLKEKGFAYYRIGRKDRS